MAISTCSSGLQVFLSPTARSSSSSSLAISYASLAPIPFPSSRGLKIGYRSRSSSVSLRSRKPRVFRQRGGVVCEAQETAVDLPAADDTTFETLVLKAAEPVLVDFWAPWCGPCRMIDPVVGKIAQQYAGKLKVYKINTDESPKVANQYGVRSIPTIMIFVNGEKKDAIIGAVPESTLTSSIEKFLQR